MIRPNVHLIAAIGESGQIGFAGGLPWPRELGDLAEFRTLTVFDVVVMGKRTAASVGNALPERILKIWNGSSDPKIFLDAIEADESLPFWATEHGTKPPTIWIAGGRHTYSSFLPFCRTMRLTRIAWNGVADTVMPRLWKA